MKYLKTFSLLLIVVMLHSCKVYTDLFVNNYDGAGCYNNLLQRQRSDGQLLYVDSLNTQGGFDAIVFMRVKLNYSHVPSVTADEINGYPEIHFELTNDFITSNPEIKEDVRRRGILASWYKHYVYGDVQEKKIDKQYEAHLDSYAIFEIKSKLGVVAIDNMYVRFWNSSWIKIEFNKSFKVQPNKLYYLGTLNLDLQKTSKYSGVTVHEGYSTYIPDVKQGYYYNIDKKLKFNKDDYETDLKFLQDRYPELYNQFKDDMQYFKWD